ncbi:MAG: hypothetical protein V4733_11720 [Verrucomicrobiota bacterium]
MNSVKPQDEGDPVGTEAFGILGLKRRLVLSDEELRAAFREAGARMHPDAGGKDGNFTRLEAARALLASPGRRLRLWLATGGIAVEPRGTVDGRLMDLFAKIGETTRTAEEIVRRRMEAKSALPLALTEEGAQRSREAVEELIAEVERELAEECGHFPAMEEGAADDVHARVRNLAFLEKWRAALRSLYARLA